MECTGPARNLWAGKSLSIKAGRGQRQLKKNEIWFIPHTSMQ